MTSMLGVTLHDAHGPLNDLNEKLASDRDEVWLRELKKFLWQEPTFAGPSMELPAQLERWQALFDSAGIDCDTSKVTIPEQQPGFDRLIVVPKGLTMNQMVKIMRGKFDMWLYTDDLDKAITKNDRSNEQSAYAIWVRDRIEADEEHKRMSANDIAKAEIVGITVLERLLYELMYFDETGKHLDIKNITLCSGSRRAGGRVPCVYWDPDNRKVDVDWYPPGHSNSYLRARAVVS